MRKNEVRALIHIAERGLDDGKCVLLGRELARRGHKRLLWQFFRRGGTNDNNRASRLCNRWLKGGPRPCNES